MPRFAPGVALCITSVLLVMPPVAGALAPEPDLPAYADRMDGAVAAVATADRGERLATAREQGLETEGRTVRVEVLSGRAHVAAARVRALGGVVTTVAPGILEARVAVGSLAELGRAGSIRRLQTPWPRVLDAVAGQGVVDTAANLAHTAGVTGAGVKVAIIDGGFGGYTQRQAAGDLPPALTTQNFCDAPGGFNGNPPTGHGTAVAEIVHEMAPGAELYLVCTDGAPDLAAAEAYLAEQGVRVVNHSVSYFNTSRGDGSGVLGTPDATVEEARNDGIFWANSAGNRAQLHWGGAFNPGIAPTNTHDWGPGDQTNSIFFPAGETQCLTLKWDSWPATDLDFQLVLIRPSPLSPLVSPAVHDGDDPPTESLCAVSATGATYQLEVRRIGHTASPRIDVFNTGGSPLNPRVAAGSVTEPSSAPEAVAAGAHCFASDLLEPFSSQGPTIDGRTKPDIAGPDGVSNATFGIFDDCPNDPGADGFYGTSASSPHLAGAAAMLLQGSSATPAQVEAALEGSARDLGTPGPDNQFGAGGLALVPGQPDLALGTQKLKLKAGKRKRADLAITNLGPLLGEMRVQAPPLVNGLRLKYLFNGDNVSNEVDLGTFAPAIPLGAGATLEVAIKAKKKAKGKRFPEFLVSNAVAPELADAARLQVKIKKRKKRKR